MSSFFTLPASQKKRKRQERTSTAPASKKHRIHPAGSDRAKAAGARDDSSISGSDSDLEDDRNSRRAQADDDDASGSDAAHETEAERRLRLAEQYLKNVRADVGAEADAAGFDAETIDKELIAARLKEDVAEEKGKLYRSIADHLDFEHATRCFFPTIGKYTTGVASCSPYVYTVSKNITLVKWELMQPDHALSLTKPKNNNQNARSKAPQRQKPKLLRRTQGKAQQEHYGSQGYHTADILCVAASADGKFVATGGADKKVIIWNTKTLKPLKVFMQHRDWVTALAFRGKTNQLFSASKDRTVKIWSLNELAYVETLFGHQDEVVDVAAVEATQERCVSVGARDRTVRLWKVVEESQLVFRGGGSVKTPKHETKEAQNTDIDIASNGGLASKKLILQSSLEGSLDRVIQIDSHLFVTGSDNGTLSLYGLHKKKPLHSISLAHGYDPAILADQSLAEVDLEGRESQGQPTPRWITALTCVPFSNLFLSGSWDGYVRAWRISDDHKKVESAGVLCKPVNSATSSPSADETHDSKSENSRISGVINDLTVFERGERGKDGLCVVAAIGTGMRLGSWFKWDSKHGAAVFEIPTRKVSGKEDLQAGKPSDINTAP